MNLKDLEGAHVLDGVDFSEEEIEHYGDLTGCQVCRFRLDGVVYAAIENPDDGYRSMMDELEIVSGYSMKNTFQPVPVVAVHISEGEYGRDEDLLQIIDATTGKLILEVGTTDISDYYPAFVAIYKPEAMSINR